jgi:hypothetical protein
MKRVGEFIVAVALATAASTVVAGPVNEFAHNRVHVYTKALTQFQGSTVTLTDSPPPVTGIVDYPDVPLAYSTSSAIMPALGDLKDQASGTIELSVLLGSLSAPDVFTFTASGTASAVSAYAVAGDPAAAIVELIATASFYLDAFGVAGSYLGTIQVGALRPASPYETFDVKISSLGHGVIATLLPGSPAAAVPLHSGDSYTLDVLYRMEVPFGVDPDFELTVGMSAQPVPEPKAALLLLAGVGILWAGTRRKRSVTGVRTRT